MRDSLVTAEAKLDSYIAAALDTVAGVNGRLFAQPLFRQWYFVVQEAKYCTNVSGDVERANTLLTWTYANLPTTPPRSGPQAQTVN